MENYRVDENIELRLVKIEDAPELFRLVDVNRKQMERFLPWAKAMKSVADEEEFIKYALGRYQKQALWPMTILVDQQVAGMFDFHNIDLENRHCDIGYWLGSEFQHNGVMTKVTKFGKNIAFNDLNMHRIQLIAQISNKSSNNVAKNSKFELEATLKDYLLANGLFRDINIYSQIFSQA